MSAVTLRSRYCEWCGAPLDGRRPHARTCSARCRQRICRARKCDTPRRLNGNGGSLLNAATREWLRAEVDRRLRKQLAATSVVARVLLEDSGKARR